MTEEEFKPGLITLPKLGFKSLSLAGQHIVPVHLDARAQLLGAGDQGTTSECVAYAVAGWIEWYRWKYHYVTEQIEPHPIYRRAKAIDGLPGDGTSLEAGLQAAVDLRLITNLEAESVKAITNAAEVLRALHRYTVMVMALNVTDGWMRATPDGWIQPGTQSLGGHAVLGCGYSLLTPSHYSFQGSWGQQGWRGFNRISQPMFEEQFLYGLVWDVRAA